MIPFYVYKIILKSTGQFYFGSRTANVRYNRLPENDLWKYYFTSSKHIKRLIKDLGKDAFEYEIIRTGFDANDIYWIEQSIIKEHVNDPQCLNKKYQDQLSGHTVFSTTGKQPWNLGLPSKFKGIPRSDETKKRISESRKGKGIGISPANKGTQASQEQKQKQSAAMKGRFEGSSNHFYGKTHSSEVKALIAANTSKHQKGRPKPKHSCPHCGLPFSLHVMQRHITSRHGENK